MGERRSRRSRKTGRRAQASALALAALAVVAPQLLGGATPETDLAILVLGFCASAFVAWALPREKSGTVPLAAVGAWLAAGWTLVQLTPLPCSFVGWLWPERMELARELVALKALDAPVCTLSLAPGATRAALAQAMVLCTVMLSAIAVSRAGQSRTLVYGVALSSVAMALVALGHLVFDAETVFGLYRPKHARPGLLLAPLLNGNNLAGLLALGLPSCLALGFATERTDVRILWFAAAFLVGTAGMFTLSRAGAGAMFVGIAGYLGYRRFGPSRRTPSGATGLVTTAALASLGMLAAFFGTDVLAGQFAGEEGTSLAKLGQSWRLTKLLQEHAFTGVGRGALVDASPSVLNGNAQVRWAESLPIQWVLDWGVPVGLTVLAFFAGSLVHGLRRKRRETAGLAFGLIAFLLQNLVDYGLELSGVAVVVAVAAGPVFAREAALPEQGYVPPLFPSLHTSLAAAGLCVLFAVPVLTTHSRASARSQLATMVGQGDSAFRNVLEDVLEYYPFDPEILLFGSANAVRAGADDTSRWLNLAMRVAPDWSAPHEQAAYWLDRVGRPSQAAIELSLAWERSSRLWASMACALIQRRGSANLARDTVGQGERRAAGLEHALRCLGRAPPEQHLLAQEVLSEFPDSILAHHVLIDAELASNNPERALELAESALEANPHVPERWELLIRTHVRIGDPNGALQVFERVPEYAPPHQGVLMAAAEAAAAISNSDAVSRLLEQLLRQVGRRAATRAGLHIFAARLYRSMGEHITAASEAQRAFDISQEPVHAEFGYQEAIRAGIAPLALHMASQLCHLRHRIDIYCEKASTAPVDR